MSARTIEMVVTDETFLRDITPMVMICGECEHGKRWVKAYSSDFGLATDWDALNALKDAIPAPPCEEHQEDE